MLRSVNWKFFVSASVNSQVCSFLLYYSQCSSLQSLIEIDFIRHFQICYSADIVIEIPGNLGQDDSSYRLDYYPPYGNPLPNTTIASRDVGDEIRFSNVLAGTKYNFWLYYTNSTHHNLLAWTVSITTGKLNIPQY